MIETKTIMNYFNISIEKVGFISDIYVTLAQDESMRSACAESLVQEAIQNKME